MNGNNCREELESVIYERLKKQYPYLVIDYVDTHYDFEIINPYNHKITRIELKTCNFRVSNGTLSKNRYGRFNFSNPENNVLQRKDNVYIMFVIKTDESSYTILGMSSAKSLKIGLPNNNQKYISWVKLLSTRCLKEYDDIICEKLM